MSQRNIFHVRYNETGQIRILSQNVLGILSQADAIDLAVFLLRSAGEGAWTRAISLNEEITNAKSDAVGRTRQTG